MGVFRKHEQLPEIAVGDVAEGSGGVRSISRAFEDGMAEGRSLIMPFLVCGYPDADAFVACAEAAGAAGADILEVGIPFSDPIMDGPVIAEAATKVLGRGQTTEQALELTGRAAKAFGGPVVAMTYYNLIMHRGLVAFAARAAEAGIAGVIVPDLSVEESLQWSVACQHAGLATIFMASVTSTEDRLHQIANASEGFIYAAGTLGVTGVRDELSTRARGLVERLRAATGKPVAVGIGVSTPEHARTVAGYADGVIVGSAVVRASETASDPAAAVGDLVSSLRAAVASAEPAGDQ